MDEMISKCGDCKNKSTAVSTLNREELELLNRNCLRREVKTGECLLKEGDAAEYVVYIRDGFIKQYKNHIRGQEHIIGIVKNGSYIGLHNIVTHRKYNYVSAEAIKDSSVCFIKKDCFDELLRVNGEFASRVISCICEDEVMFVDRLLKNQEQQLYGRLAEVLLYFMKIVYGENPFTIDLSRSELASFIGASRESMTRALKDFQESGYIRLTNKHIHVLNEQKLLSLTKNG